MSEALQRLPPHVSPCTTLRCCSLAHCCLRLHKPRGVTSDVLMSRVGTRTQPGATAAGSREAAAIQHCTAGVVRTHCARAHRVGSVRVRDEPQLLQIRVFSHVLLAKVLPRDAGAAFAARRAAPWRTSARGHAAPVLCPYWWMTCRAMCFDRGWSDGWWGDTQPGLLR